MGFRSRNLDRERHMYRLYSKGNRNQSLETSNSNIHLYNRSAPIEPISLKGQPTPQKRKERGQGDEAWSSRVEQQRNEKKESIATEGLALAMTVGCRQQKPYICNCAAGPLLFGRVFQFSRRCG